MSNKNFISIRQAREHNLKGIDLDIPRGKFIVITGLSGSGKSSLAFDTIYAEGQRRYIESLSSYARQFLDQMEKPDVESITGLTPTITILNQRNQRSSLAPQLLLINFLLRVLFAGQKYNISLRGLRRFTKANKKILKSVNAFYSQIFC